jgi:hypothetical protein
MLGYSRYGNEFLSSEPLQERPAIVREEVLGADSIRFVGGSEEDHGLPEFDCDDAQVWRQLAI